jgi:catechol 2,3-dioxygenase-like lactoylglutathione lyase family enzyme
MASLHHVNLGVPVGGADAEGAFLVDFLGYEPVQLAAADPPTARWFESEDGKQIHLSEDPEHRPAARAHVAVDFGNDLAALEHKFEQAGYKFRVADGNDRRTVLCRDPAGNRWELRGTR